MMRFLFASLAVVASVGLVGCGLSPQYLTPEPRFTGQLMKVGQGQPVVVRVSDARTSQIIGAVVCMHKAVLSRLTVRRFCRAYRRKPTLQCVCWALRQCSKVLVRRN